MSDDTQTPFHRNDALFHRELVEGHRWATRVGDRLRQQLPPEHGLTVEVTPMEWRDSIDDVKRFRTEKDIVIRRPDGAWTVVEVKSRGLEFGDEPRSYPDWMPTAIVDTVDGWNTKVHRDQVAAVVLVSQLTAGMLVVPVATTRTSWITRQRFDDKRKHLAWNYEVPRQRLRRLADLLHFLTTGEW